jgi:hypothetical protein
MMHQETLENIIEVEFFNFLIYSILIKKNRCARNGIDLRN